VEVIRTLGGWEQGTAHPYFDCLSERRIEFAERPVE
jgi:hypothetical protein